MAKLTSFPALLLLFLCFSSFFSGGLSGRPISDEATVDGVSDWWFSGNFHFPKNEWPFVHPPLPAGGFEWPKKKWPFVYPPMAAGENWPFLKPFPCPWWPKKGHSVHVEVGVGEGDAPASSPSS